jgi:4-amino-4-deoxy-L-arabinose transferase-like glycosyltransferase
MVFGTQIYHQIGSLIEKAFSSQSILFRFYLIRIFSVLLGMLVILLSYLIAKTIGFSSKHALLLTAIISFQPKFSMYFAGINYDVLLIPMFVLFTWAGLLALKQGLNWKNLFLMLFSIVVAVLTKSTGYILAIPFAFLLTYLLFEKVRTKNKMIQYFSYILSFVAFVGLAFILKNHLPSQGNSIGQILNSISNYLNKSLSIGRFGLSSRTYWGTLGWTNNWFMDNVTNLIWLIQAFSLAGLGIFFFGKGEKPSYLPEKKYVAFLIGMIIALQLGIRTADWSIFSQTGSLDLGTPGRYFLPNLPAHIILVFVGLGMLFAHFKKEKYLDYSLLAGLILMFAFSMYLIFDVIIFRFYL